MTSRSWRIMWAFVCPIFCLNAYTQTNWPQWRGPDFTGSADVSGLPVTWSENENIAWKTPLPSWSGGSPIVWEDRIFVTSPSKGAEGGAGAAENRPPVGPELLLLCLDKKTGAILWERELDTGNKEINKQNDSSPSPVTDGKHVWALTGTGVLTALTMEGEILWKRNLQTEYGPFGLNFGYGASPLLLDGKIVVQVLHGYRTEAPSYIVAFDGQSGKALWRVERPTEAIRESRDAYITPAPLFQEGKTAFVVTGGDYVTAHDLATGQEIWRAGGLNPRNTEKNRIIVSPMVCGGKVYAMSTRKPLLVFRTGGSGNITESHLAWKYDGAYGPDVPTPACGGGDLYLLDDKGVITCFNAETGAILWGPEHTAKGIVSASPLLADAKIYVTNEEAVTTVLAAGPEFKILATNTLDNVYTLSSMAVSGSQLFLRTATHLYCIANAKQQ